MILTPRSMLHADAIHVFSQNGQFWYEILTKTNLNHTFSVINHSKIIRISDPRNGSEAQTYGSDQNSRFNELGHTMF